VQNRNCGSCYRDAYVLIVNRLKNMTKLPDNEQERNYALKAGEFIQYFGEKEFIVNPVTDAQAEKFLGQFPKRITIFSRYPEDWEARVEARKQCESSTESDTDTSDSEDNGDAAESGDYAGTTEDSAPTGTDTAATAETSETAETTDDTAATAKKGRKTSK
jgi:hypothetical protein